MNLLDLNNYERLDKIGEGTSGVVFLVKHKESGKIFAAKVWKATCDFEDEQDSIYFEREINTMSTMTHPSILRCYGYSKVNFTGADEPVIILEYAKNKALRDQIDLQRRSLSDSFDDTKKLICIYGIASGMQYLHSNKIIHRDLKPDNILLDDNYYPKISDFGLAKKTTPDAFQSAAEIKGTISYMAPEIFTSVNYTSACDVYAFSIIVYEIITTEIPYRGLTQYQIQRNVGLLNVRPEFPEFPIPEAYKSLITRCWAQNPDDRPSFDEIVDELENIDGFITDTVDEDEYRDYIDLIKNATKACDTSKILEPEKKLERLKNAADEGDPKSMYEYGNLLYNGEITEVNKVEACRYYKMAADKGEPRAMNKYADMRYNGDAVPMDKEVAFQYYTKGAAKGDINAMNSCGNILDVGEIFEPNKEEACRFFKMAADQGHVDAMNNYGFMLFNGVGTAIDQKEASRYFKMAADKGNISAMFNYANMLDNGLGVETNKKEACRYYKMGADQGDINAMNNYATMLYNGYGVNIDATEASKYYKMAAEKGQINAMYNYGNLLDLGHGVDMNKEEACRYYKMAADNGLAKAMFSYANMLNQGSGVKMNKKEACTYYQKAAEKGNIYAMYQYGVMLDNGEGVKMDKNKACYYYKMAADRGHANALENYNKLIQNASSTNQNGCSIA